ncbi:hypothetical protein RHEph03_gp013 [Rhizobium phage RHEph03]|uniref:Uncharacterized protein n=2 Tax=Cuernavacavirus RHEph02 TaxID=2733899 RepID=L7TKM6_9CAUD|nr:hypothetical protein HOS21_gp13 [Rhizobium phage RHEph02]AGC35580.1 hypothetical protein RHEph02_gp013 [Rhizobium phage RHEph02]AGC35640.1 hypothetical protein RHEph03_gp013 [Rhizobium phage RHEph03]
MLDAHAARVSKVYDKHRRAKEKLHNHAAKLVDIADATARKHGTIINQELDTLDAQLDAIKARKADVIRVGETLREQSEDKIRHLREVRAKIAGVQISGV